MRLFRDIPPSPTSLIESAELSAIVHVCFAGNCHGRDHRSVRLSPSESERTDFLHSLCELPDGVRIQYHSLFWSVTRAVMTELSASVMVFHEEELVVSGSREAASALDHKRRRTESRNGKTLSMISYDEWIQLEPGRVYFYAMTFETQKT